MRRFEGGATRDSEEGKFDYEAFLSYPVLEKYAEYMHSHRKQIDGSLREGDNWQSGFGEQHFNVCMKSLWRHFLDMWAIHRGYKRIDKKDGHEITILESACAILFNVMAFMHIYLKETKNE